MDEENEKQNLIGKENRIAVWFDDDITFLKELRSICIQYNLRVETIDSEQLRDAVEYFTRRGESVLLLTKVIDVRDMDLITNIIGKLMLQVVISDLEMAHNTLAGISILAVVGRYNPKCYRGIVTGHIDETVATLVGNMGIDIIESKDSVSIVMEEVAQIIGPRRDLDRQDLESTIEKLSKKYRLMERKNAEFESENKELKRSRNRLRRMLRELQSDKASKKKQRKKESDVERDHVIKRAESAERLVQMVLGHQHDLKSVAASVTTALGSLCAQPELLPPAVKDKLEGAWTASKHSSVLIASTLDIATDEKPSKQATGSIPQSFNEAHSIIAEQMPDRISLSISLPEEMRVAKIPDDMLMRCALNIFTNAKDAIVGRGLIKVTTKSRSSARSKYVEVFIHDNGRGIKKRDLPKVFDWGFSTKGSRYGMGLFIVKKIMERYGGQVKIESLRGKGTSVTLRIPVG